MFRVWILLDPFLSLAEVTGKVKNFELRQRLRKGDRGRPGG